MEGMFRSQEAQKAAETLISHIDVMKTDLRVVQSQCPGDMLQLEEHNDDLEKEAIGMANEAQVLKKSAPEGNVEDSNVQMYLAIAELEKTNSILRQQQKITQDNVKSLVQDVEGTKDIISEMAKMKDFLCNMKADDEENNPNAGNKVEPAATDINHKIRSSRKVFKELKTFLGEFLNRIDPIEGTSGGNLGMLVQKLWDTFQNEKEEYVQISHLEFDIEPSHVDLLVKNHIAVVDPNDNDKIRLEDFTG